jgi:glycogen operon protein
LSAWAELGVDGFRFDLGSVLGRDATGFSAASPLLAAIRSAPALEQCKLIAEPWDVDGYFLGKFPAGWAQWNDKFRDTMRALWRGDKVGFGKVATRMAGSSDLFHAPTASVNFVASHDGFTLDDAVSYAQKHNAANGEDDRDGTNGNVSANWGVEGPTRRADVLAARAKAKRNLLASLCLAQGVPMLLAGDEIGRSQQGNNNAYCQDNAVSWIDWSTADTALLADVRKLLAFRKAHPELRRARLFAGEAEDGGPKDIAWLRPEGGEIAPDAWHDLKAFGFLIAGTLLVLMNPGPPLTFHLPEGRWTVFMDTARGDGSPAIGTYALADHALAILERA